jgi:hypothetical protein
MNIRPLACRDMIPAVSFSHEYDEDERKHINVSYVVVDDNDKVISKVGECYEACEALIDTIIDEEEYHRNYDPSNDVIDTLFVERRIDGGEDHACLMADGSLKMITRTAEQLKHDATDCDIPF